MIQYLIRSAITDSFFDYLSSVSFASAFEHSDAFDDDLQWSSVSVFCLFSLSAEGEIHAEQVVKKKTHWQHKTGTSTQCTQHQK